MTSDAKASDSVTAILQKHRRHVELSPGAGESAQKYALACIDDIEADLVAASPFAAADAEDAARFRD